ncbi:MAG TPA: hypothetical protein EYP22_03980 [Methanosarcinales archaeon]|nr:hypothetical protein [Methanosarcinales archaeon]
MILMLHDLEKGISWWLKTKWPQDFHNEVYYELYDLRKHGLTVKWWKNTVDRLWLWRAIRSRKPPNTKKEIYERGLEIFSELQEYYAYISNKAKGEPVFLEFTWAEIRAFYDKLAWIKDSSLPNFPSKLGHFIFPNLFMVMDHQATGIVDYAVFWSSMSGYWSSFKQKEEAKKTLTDRISEHSKRPVHEYYPFEIKIIELCSIGKKHADA